MQSVFTELLCLWMIPYCVQMNSYFLQYYYIAPWGGRGGGVLLEILGWGMPPGSPNPDPISDQKKSFFTPVLRPGPVFRPGLEEIMSSLLRTATIKIFLKIHFDFVCFSFFLTHMEFLHSRRSLENHTRFQTKTDKLYTRFQTKTKKNPTPWGGTHLHGLYKGVNPGYTAILYYIVAIQLVHTLSTCCGRGR